MGKNKSSSIGMKNWIIIVFLGLSGQIAWNVENSWLNTFVFDKITPDPQPVAIMVAISAIVATITTFVMGTVSDRVGKRKPFILWGYVLWGISTMLFPTITFVSTTTLAVVLVVTVDAVMTFFGSTAYDSAFNAWTTDISDETNRGKLNSVLVILPLVAMIIGTALSGAIIDTFGYEVFFYSLGGIVSVIGFFGALLLKDAPKKAQALQGDTNKTYKPKFWANFSKEQIMKNKKIYLIMVMATCYTTAYQIATPFNMIYLNNYLDISKTVVGTMMAVPLIVSAIIAIPVGRLFDKGHRYKLVPIGIILFSVGFLSFSAVSSVPLLIGAMCCIYIGLLMLTACSNAWMRNLFPSKSRGQYEGIRMVFLVAFPMVLGPSIGSAIIKNFGVPTVVNGEAGFIPTPILYAVTAIVALLTFIPLVLIHRTEKKELGGSEHRENKVG